MSAAGSVIAGISLGFDVLKELLSELGNIDRKIAIGLDNETGLTFTAAKESVYFESGTSDDNLPYTFESGQAGIWGARKVTGPTATGTVGVFAYSTSNGDTLAVMWSVPYDFDLYSSWWNVKMYSGAKNASKDLYEELYKAATFKGDNEWHTKDIGQGYNVRGSMANSGTPTLEIHVEQQ